MVTKVTETLIKCDVCSQEIVRPLGVHKTTFANLEELDICMECSCIILENLFNSDVITSGDVKRVSNHYAINARSNNIVLC